MAFKPAGVALVFYSFVLLLGVVVLAIGLSIIALNGFDLKEQIVVTMGLGLGLALIGSLLLRYGTAPIVFDRRGGHWWKGRKNPDEVLDKEKLGNFLKLKDISCLQIIKKHVPSETSFDSYELNVVMKDGARLNVVDHGDEASLKEDASKLAEFLSVRVVSRSES